MASQIWAESYPYCSSSHSEHKGMVSLWNGSSDVASKPQGTETSRSPEKLWPHSDTGQKKGRSPVWVRFNKDSRSHTSVQEYVCFMIANTVTMWKLHNIKQMMSLLVFWGNMVYLCRMTQVSSICFLKSCWFSLQLLKVDHFNLCRSAGGQRCFGYNNILRHWMWSQAGDTNSGCSISGFDFSVPSVDLWSSESVSPEPSKPEPLAGSPSSTCSTWVSVHSDAPTTDSRICLSNIWTWLKLGWWRSTCFTRECG